MIPYINLLKKVVSRNASDLLLIGGVGSIVTGGIILVKKSPKIVHTLDKMQHERTSKKIKTVAPMFVPSLTLTALGVGEIIFSRHIVNNKVAAMATACTAAESAFKTYRTKVEDMVEPEKYEKIKKELAADKLSKNPIKDNEIIMESDNDVLMYDSMSGRYFKSSTNFVDRAVNNINKKLLNEMYMQLNDFYSELDNPDLDYIKIGSNVGWTVDHQLEVCYTASIAKNNKPCIVVDYDVFPI